MVEKPRSIHSRKPWRLPLAVILVCAAVLGVAQGPAPGASEAPAREILDAAGVRGGLVVHVGCGRGELTAALRANDSYLVHGLDTDPAKVAAARKHIRKLGLYGKVSVARLTGDRLPYADNLVNLVVSEDLDKVSMAEVMRALVPGGVAYVKRSQPGAAVPQWTKTVKPWPGTIDEWSHYLHDASNNGVARDTQVGPPRRMKWVCGPLWTRSHEFTSSLCAMVSAKGRLFYVFDEGLTGVTPASLPERWTLIARDAFNGVLLWKRPLAKWRGARWRNRALRSSPATIPRRLVARGDRVFVTLGYDAPVSVLDAATGKTLTTYKATAGTEEIRCLDGVLLIRKGANAVVAIDTKTGRKLWEAAGKIQPLSLAAQDGKVFYQAGQNLFCVGIKDGKKLWQAACEARASLLVVHGGRVLVPRRGQLQALSAATGKVIWSVKARLAGRGELFVAGGKVWHWEGHNIVGRDLESGKVTARPKTDDVFTPGHHLRCYQSKATERFFITPNRGVEFVSLTGGENTQNDWLRGPCKYGIMPCNGLLYVPPNPCFCYPGVKVTGFNVLAPAAATRETARGDRLTKGPAYGKVNPQSASAKATADRSAIRNPQLEDWPTYRHDARRSGATACEVPARVATQWQVNLRGRLTPPVVCGDRVYVAAKDRHTVHAITAQNGKPLWSFTADGRIDSPPTIHEGMVLFGCADGRVYCLRASDGKLAWRFRAGPSDRQIIAFGQLESPWRVHGSVLVTGGIAYCTAGRSTYLDGGIRVFGLDPKTGKVMHETRLDTWARTREDAKGKPFIPGYHIEGAFSDILVSEGGHIYLGQYKLDRSLKQQDVPYALIDPKKGSGAMGMKELMDKPYVQNVGTQKRDEPIQRNWQLRQWPQMAKEHKAKYGASNLGERTMGRHVFSTGGFLDDSWYNRTFWMYSETWPGFHIANRGAKTGQLLVAGPAKTYAVQAYPTRNLQSPLFTPGGKGYLLFADDNDNEPVLPDYTRGVPKGIGFTRKNPPAWFKWVPVRIRGMVLAGKHLFVAGAPDVVDPDDPMAAFEGRKGAVLRAHSAADGKKLAEIKLDAPPVFDGLIAAGGRLYLVTVDGKVVCFGKQ